MIDHPCDGTKKLFILYYPTLNVLKFMGRKVETIVRSWIFKNLQIFPNSFKIKFYWFFRDKIVPYQFVAFKCY
jgi:hypothetical protein